MATSLKRIRKVALSGFYGRGSFGDDLMAVIFGKHLQRIGVSFTVFGLPPHYSRQYGFQTTDTVEELLADCQVLLWGGGGLLVSWSPLIYRLLFKDFAHGYADLIRKAVDRNIKIGAFSVGGNGSQPSRITPSFKQTFLENAQYMSVRNPQDLAALRQYNIGGDCFPDVIWQTRSLFTPRPSHSTRIRIGMDIYWSILLRHYALHIIPLLHLITKIRSDGEFIFIDTTDKHKAPYRAVGKHWRGDNIQLYQFSELEKDLNMLASFDLFLSSRLHSPMVAMQYGIPVLSLFSERKTSLFFKNCNLQEYCIAHREMRRFWSLMTSREDLSDAITNYTFPKVDELTEKSSGHLEALTRFLGQ